MSDDIESLITRLSNASVIPTAHECLRAAALIEQQAKDIAALQSDIEAQIAIAKGAEERAALFRALLDDMAKEFVRVFPIYYYAEPWAHDRNVVLRTARAALAQEGPT